MTTMPNRHHRQTTPIRVVVAVAVVVLTAAGCGPVVDQTTRTSVDSSLDELTEDHNKQRLNELMELQGVETAGRHFGRGLSWGMISTAGTLDGQLEQMDIQRRVETAFQLIANQLEQQLGPVLQEVAASTTRSVLEEIGSPENRRRAARMAAAVTDAVIDTVVDGLRGQLGPAVRQMLVDHVGPGIQQILVDHVGPGIQQMLDDEFNEALGETARVVSRQAAIGTTEGLVEMEIIDPDEPTLTELAIERFTEAVEALGWVFWVLVFVFGAVFLTFVGWALRLVLQARDIKKKGDVRDITAAQLAEAIRRVEAGDSEAGDQLREASRTISDLEDED